MYVSGDSHEAASDMFSTLCDSGLFDAEIRSAYCKLEGESTSPKKTVDMQIRDAAGIHVLRRQSKSMRASVTALVHILRILAKKHSGGYINNCTVKSAKRCRFHQCSYL